MRPWGGNHQARLLCGAAVVSLLAAAAPSYAQQVGVDFNIPPQSLQAALDDFSAQSRHGILARPELTASKVTPGVSGVVETEAALRRLLEGTGLSYRLVGETYLIVQAGEGGSSPQGAGAGDVDALIVTAQKKEENIQDVPIAISAFTQDDLTTSQIAGGPDLMTQVPNMTFTKTNFTGYSIQIRGIGTQAVSATTDAAVAVSFNNTSFIRNRFFEQEFYDLERVEVLRGPQGTLYGRNATAGVVNIISAKPKFLYEAKASADVANYSSSRIEGMVNIPLVEDKVALRLAGAWTKREGYSTNEITGSPIDGRDLWSTRLSLRFAPTDAFEANLIWEHFEENDDRLRSGKQLCKQDDRKEIGGLTVAWSGYSNVFSQGCLPASLYSPDSFQAPDGYSLPYYLPLQELGLPITPNFNPYASLVQSPDLRVIESTVDPEYTADSDLVQLEWSLDLNDSLTLTSETAYQYDTIFSLEDYNRFNTASGAFVTHYSPAGHRFDYIHIGPNGTAEFCDPQVGCADRVVAVDVSRAKTSHFSQEFRLSSDFDGPLNFNFGANFLRYDTEDKYYVFINTLSMFAALGGYQVFGDLRPWDPGGTDNSECLTRGQQPPEGNKGQLISGCIYLDPNPIKSVNDRGHNYFLSRNPYKLISYAAFGELYYEIADNLKLTAGLRLTVDKKEAPRIPSWVLGSNRVGYSVLNVEEQEWREPTGRLAIDWKPDFSFTDETLLYASYARGYKAGGSNPPPSGVVGWGLSGVGDSRPPEVDMLVLQSASKPRTFEPEYVNAFELGAKNTMFDGNVTLNLAAFYYDYEGYQISQIIDRSAVNYNFDADVWGLEIEADWRALENLRLGFKGGYENTRIADGERAIDIMDRTAGNPDWVVMRPFPSFPSNCVLPLYTIDAGDGQTNASFNGGAMGPCEYAYVFGLDPVTRVEYMADPDPAPWLGYRGYNPKVDVGQNNGEGFFKQLGGNELPNAPNFTATITADYTLPLPNEWLMTLHTDLYYQSEAWTRVFNTEGYDRLKAYTNVNLAAIFTNEDLGWKAMFYVKNAMDRDSITGAFLNSDDTGLTTNVFLTEPRLYGVRVTKEFTGGPWWTGANPGHKGPYPLTIELGGSAIRQDAPYRTFAPGFVGAFSRALDPTATQHRDLDWGDGREVRLTYKPVGGLFSIVAGFRTGESNTGTGRLHSEEIAGPRRCPFSETSGLFFLCDPGGPAYTSMAVGANWSDSATREHEEHVLVDFAVGRDFGLGALADSRSTISVGLRYAQFKSSTSVTMDGVPDLKIPHGFGNPGMYPSTYHHYAATIEAEREFEGMGPELTWDAAKRLLGNEDVGHVDLDWSVTGGVLFGKQMTTVDGTVGEDFVTGPYLSAGNVMAPLDTTPLGITPRNNSLMTPFVDLRLGLAYEISRVKIGAGYRWERYFDVLDAGYEDQKTYDRTIDGPYFKIAVGFGG